MSDETTEPAVLVEQRDRILIVTINRPKAKNAVNLAVSQGLADAMDRLDGDPGLSVGIVTGAGGSFCAGMDLKAFARGERCDIDGRSLGFTQRPPAKPLIAAVEGYALAGGTEVALSCDLIVASRESAFGIPEVKRGLVAGGGGLLRLPQRIPYAIAMELALTGDNLTATFSSGLVDVQIFVVDVAGGDKVPRKGGPGVTFSDLLVVNKTDLAPMVGADLDVMRRDAAQVRGERPTVLISLTEDPAASAVQAWVREQLAGAGVTNA